MPSVDDWPANARETLLAVLRDHRSAASDRVLAASLAGDITVMNDEAADLLLSIVQSTDGPARLRASAAGLASGCGSIGLLQ